MLAHGSSLDSTTIFVPLFCDGGEVWRPYPAVRLGDGQYLLGSPSDFDPDDEAPAFLPGDHVECEERRLSGEPVLVAVRVATTAELGGSPLTSSGLLSEE